MYSFNQLEIKSTFLSYEWPKTKEFEQIEQIVKETFDLGVDYIEYCLCSYPIDKLYVAKKDDTVVGVIWTTRHMSECYVVILAVKKQHRRKGIGTKLLDLATKDYSEINLHVESKNTEALLFYFHNGFENTQTIPDYYPDDDAWFMVKKIN